VQALALIGAQIGLAAGLVVPRFVARARFHGRQDVHQSGSIATFSEYARHQIFLANVALAHVLDVNARCRADLLRPLPNALSQRFGKSRVVKDADTVAYRKLVIPSA
jgi:hypothetical protein